MRGERVPRAKPSKLKRTTQIAKVLAHYGFEFLVESPSPWSYLLSPSKLLHKQGAHEHSPAERVRIMLEELGPTYIKVGQAASTRPDLVPDAYIRELSKLQDQAPPVPYHDVSHAVKIELGLSPENKFACFEKQPRGSASLSQAHDALLPDGEQVVVKVQRPGIRDRIDADLLVLHDVVEFLSSHSFAGKAVDLKGWFSEFEFTLLNELDFTREGHNAERFRKNFECDESLYVPKIYWEYTTPRVLTLELIQGTKISDLDELRRKGLDPAELARTATLIMLKMVYEHGFFHADPHSGNFFVLDDGRLALIDFGMVGRLEPELKDSFLRIALAVARHDSSLLTDEVLSFAYSEGRVDREGLKRDINRLLITNMEGGSQRLSMAKMLNQTLTAAANHGLVVPSSVAVLARTFTMSEGLGAMLDPSFNLAAFAEPYLEEIFTKRYSREALMERAKFEGPFLADLLLRLPKRAERILSRVERGEFTVISRIDDEAEMLRHLHMAANRISVSFLTAALMIALTILTIVYYPHGFHGWSDAIMLALLVAVCGAGVVLLVSIWRSGKKED